MKKIVAKGLMRSAQALVVKGILFSGLTAVALVHNGGDAAAGRPAPPPPVAVASADLPGAPNAEFCGGSEALDQAAALVCAGAPAVTPPTPSSTVPAGYHLTFDDEFTTVSISDVDTVPARWYTHTVQCCLYDTSNPSTPTQMNGITDPVGQNPFSIVPGGGLDIRLQKTNGTWHSGVIATVNRQGQGFSQKYGYFEMKAKFPAVPGTWPSFWLLNSAALSQNANPGEIDVVESYMQFLSSINITLHDWTPPATAPGYKNVQTADLSVGYHTFGMLWTAASMSFYCDGIMVYSLPTPPIMNQPYYPIVDLGLGGGWPTNLTPAQSDLLVQYVRVYAPNS
jgi:Glycosyl hydrolases family 16